MGWLDGPWPHADAEHPEVRWGIDVNQFQPLDQERHWNAIVDNAVVRNQHGTSRLERVVIRVSGGVQVDRALELHVRWARWAQDLLRRRGLPPFELGGYMLLRPPGLLSSVRAQVRCYLQASRILGAERRSWSAVDVEGHAAWHSRDAAGAASDAVRRLSAAIESPVWLYSYPSFWRDFSLRHAGPLWGAYYTRSDWPDVDHAYRRPVQAWQFGGGPLAGTTSWPAVSKSVIRF